MTNYSWAERTFAALPQDVQDQAPTTGSWYRRLAALAEQDLLGSGGGSGTADVPASTTEPTPDPAALWLHPSKTVNNNADVPTLHWVVGGAWAEFMWKVDGVWRDTAPADPSTPPDTWTRTESNDPSVVETGTWSAFSHANYSGGSIRQSSEAGATISYTFTGVGIRLISARATSFGIGRVYIDGAEHGTFDSYASTTAWQQVLYEATGLADGEHTITVEVTGTKNPSASDTRIFVDAFDVGTVTA